MTNGAASVAPFFQEEGRMSKVNVIAVEPVNGNAPGSILEVSEHEAQQLVRKGLVKMQGPASNKMKATPENKANPSPAAGKAQKSSASPVARASQKTTAKKSVAGARAAKTDE
jgi:hypothetical protein